MNVRHAAALALVGWYLMVPPYRYVGAGLAMESRRTLQHPDRLRSYLQEMKEDPGALHGEYKVASKFQTEGLNKMRHMRIDPFALRYAGCIFSDDPRLDEN